MHKHIHSFILLDFVTSAVSKCVLAHNCVLLLLLFLSFQQVTWQHLNHLSIQSNVIVVFSSSSSFRNHPQKYTQTHTHTLVCRLRWPPKILPNLLVSMSSWPALASHCCYIQLINHVFVPHQVRIKTSWPTPLCILIPGDR